MGAERLDLPHLVFVHDHSDASVWTELAWMSRSGVDDDRGADSSPVPWACVLILSGTLAHAAEEALTHAHRRRTRPRASLADVATITSPSLAAVPEPTEQLASRRKVEWQVHKQTHRLSANRGPVIPFIRIQEQSDVHA